MPAAKGPSRESLGAGHTVQHQGLRQPWVKGSWLCYPPVRRGRPPTPTFGMRVPGPGTHPQAIPSTQEPSLPDSLRTAQPSGAHPNIPHQKPTSPLVPPKGPSSSSVPTRPRSGATSLAPAMGRLPVSWPPGLGSPAVQQPYPLWLPPSRSNTTSFSLAPRSPSCSCVPPLHPSPTSPHPGAAPTPGPPCDTCLDHGLGAPGLLAPPHASQTALTPEPPALPPATLQDRPSASCPRNSNALPMHGEGGRKGEGTCLSSSEQGAWDLQTSTLAVGRPGGPLSATSTPPSSGDRLGDRGACWGMTRCPGCQ